MRKMTHRSACMIVAMSAAAVPVCSRAAGAWIARTDKPDVFGQTNVFVVAEGEENSIVIQCDDQDKLFVAFIFEKKKFDEIPNLPADLLVQVDGSAPIRLPAELKSWNDSYAGVVAEGRTNEITGVVHAIGGAMHAINAGISIAGHRVSASFDADGSTSAVLEAEKGCKLADPPRKSPVSAW